MSATVMTVRASGERLDTSLTGELPDHSRTHVQELIRAGLIEVNGRIVRKPAYVVSLGDTIRVLPKLPLAEAKENTPIPPLNVVFENSDLLVLNKAPGIVVHPSPGHVDGTLAQAVFHHVPGLEAIGDKGREGLVHRLDRDTSGLIVFAKNQASLDYLQAQFKLRKVRKTYLALVDGGPPTATGRVEARIGRNPRNRQRFSVLASPAGKESVTEYSVRDRFARHTLLEVYPITGRTHQVRVHLQFLKCPVVGDTVYGRRVPSLDVSRHLLHASKLSFVLPSDTAPTEFQAQLPEDINSAIELAHGA